MSEFRSTIFYSVLIVFVGVILISVWHSVGGSAGGVPEAGLGAADTPQPTAVTTGGTTLTPSDHADAHLIPAPDAAEIPASGREYEVSLTVYSSIDLALTTRSVRFSHVRTGEAAVETGHECEPAAVREVIVTRQGGVTDLTAVLDRAPGDTDRSVAIRLIGPNINQTQSAVAAGYQDADGSGDYNADDGPAETEASVQWQDLTGGQVYTAFASLDGSLPSHTTRGVTWTVGREDEASRDPVVASRVHAPAGSHVALASCEQGAGAELLLIDGESMAAHGDGGRTVRIYGVETTP